MSGAGQPAGPGASAAQASCAFAQVCASTPGGAPGPAGGVDTPFLARHDAYEPCPPAGWVVLDSGAGTGSAGDVQEVVTIAATARTVAIEMRRTSRRAA